MEDFALLCSKFDSISLCNPVGSVEHVLDHPWVRVHENNVIHP